MVSVPPDALLNLDLLVAHFAEDRSHRVEAQFNAVERLQNMPRIQRNPERIVWTAASKAICRERVLILVPGQSPLRIALRLFAIHLAELIERSSRHYGRLNQLIGTDDKILPAPIHVQRLC